MSSPVSGDDERLALDHFFRSLSNSIIGLDIGAASTALILYDWALTSGDEFTFVWRRSKNNYARILFICARYPALASAILSMLSGDGPYNAKTWLQVFTIICSELILATRAWAIWARSRRILTFLAIFIPLVKGVSSTRRFIRCIVTPSVVLVTKYGTVVYGAMTGTAKRFLVISYVSIMVIEVVVVALTLFKIFQYYKDVPRRMRSKLLDVLWIDGLMYFVFMLLIGILNVGLVLHESDSSLNVGCPELQTALHSILSTRIVLHTTTVLKQDIADSRAAVAQDRLSTRMEFARDTTIEIVAN